MSLVESTSPARRTRTGRVRRLLTVGVSAAVCTGSIVAGSQASRADDQRYPLRDVSTISVIGHGYGHGRGMSQWGAYGAATDGLGYASILAFYYPGTTLTTEADPSMRVLISADNDGSTHVLPATGMALCDGAGKRTLLSTNPAITSWRVVLSSGALRLQYYAAGYHTTSLAIAGPSATFTRSTSCSSLGAVSMSLALPDGSLEGIRGGIRAQIYGSGLRTVGVMGMSSYLASVVPSEMPPGWAAEALKAQSVAARSYSARYRQVIGSSTPWDICDTTSCQVFHGTAAETPASTAAVAATAGKILTYGGAIALTEFSASNGGWTTAGSSSTPYLKAKADPYDGVVATYGSWPNPHTWTASLSVSTLERDFPSIGTFVRLDVPGRDGNGDFGGRTTSVVIQGNAGHVTVSGSQFAGLAGFTSVWWTVRYAGLDHDLTNDGRADLVLRNAADGSMRVYPSASTTSLGSPLVEGSGWGGMDQILIAGDMTGDENPDIVARQVSTGSLFLYPGNAAGWVTSGHVILPGPSPYSMIVAPGDFSGDGHPDLLAVNATTHQLILLRGNGAGGLQPGSTVIGTGWNVFNSILGAGDLNGNGYVDLLAREVETGQLRIYYGNGAGGFKTSTALPGSYSSVSLLTVPGDITGDSRADIVGVSTGTGQLVRFSGISTGFAPAAVLDSTNAWRAFNTIS